MRLALEKIISNGFCKYLLFDNFQFVKMTWVKIKLQSEVSTNAFDNVRGKMGIKNLDDLEKLKNLPKTKINHHKFDTY